MSDKPELIPSIYAGWLIPENYNRDGRCDCSCHYVNALVYDPTSVVQDYVSIWHRNATCCEEHANGLARAGQVTRLPK